MSILYTWDEEVKKNMKPRDKNDHYPTHPDDVKKSLSLVKNISNPTILDIGCGKGVWGTVAKNEVANIGGCCTQITGIDIQEFPVNSDYDKWIVGKDFFEWETEEKFSLIIGNPPFKYAQKMIEKSFDMLEDGGQLIFLLRLAFLESQRRYEFFKKYIPNEVSVFSKRPSFTGDGKTYPIAFAAFSWVKGFDGNTKLSWLK